MAEIIVWLQLRPQKTSGVRFHPKVGREFKRFLGSAPSRNETGYDSFLNELKKINTEAAGLEPKLLA